LLHSSPISSPQTISVEEHKCPHSYIFKILRFKFPPQRSVLKQSASLCYSLNMRENFDFSLYVLAEIGSKHFSKFSVLNFYVLRSLQSI
jgi:hypothetical protein